MTYPTLTALTAAVVLGLTACAGSDTRVETRPEKLPQHGYLVTEIPPVETREAAATMAPLPS